VVQHGALPCSVHCFVPSPAPLMGGRCVPLLVEAAEACGEAAISSAESLAGGPAEHLQPFQLSWLKVGPRA
jgi:hypothetical protein